jgi:ankyrin repeat protein
LSRGAEVGARSAQRGETPLHNAALNGNLAMIELLVSRGADPNARDDHGVRPFHYASRHLQGSAVQLLRRLGAHEDNLFEAINAGDVGRVHAFLASGIDVNAPDLHGTPLHLAVATNQVAVALMLIDAGADLEAVGDPAGAHPLHLATLHGHAAMARLLIERGATLEARDGHGRTPLIVAANFGKEDLAKLLLDAGADPLAKDDIYGETAILLAALSGNTKIAALLPSHGVDVNYRSGHRGASPLHYAAGYGQLTMVRFLVAHGADMGITDKSGMTPYQFAVMCPSHSAATLKELGY